MRGLKSLLVALATVLVPTTTFAQASLSGVVRDSSGAVLPGVTVEASSPVLIEKVRTAVTDSTGRYQIIDLRPGSYQRRITQRRVPRTGPGLPVAASGTTPLRISTTGP